jgi:hypothetical protein
MKVTVRVTTSDIRRGLHWEGHTCPVALALKRATNYEYLFRVGFRSIHYRKEVLRTVKRVNTPMKVRKFLPLFDSGQKVQPFEFMIHL